MKPLHAHFPIVGLGASAGGIQALEGFFKGLQDDASMAFVVVTHLSPDRVSHLHEVVGRYTSIPVRVAENGAEVERGCVYVMPENAVMTIEGGRLQIRRQNGAKREHKPIDIFFSALAKDQGEYAAGIVLSGGDGDGTLGIKAIKERGGLTLAQTSDGSGPRYPDMPNSAISTGLVDLAIPAEEMGARLAQFARGFDLLDGLALDQGRAGETPEAQTRAREAIYAILRNEAGHDFSGYKTKTFLRRVQRRMQVVHLDTLGAYLERLRKDPDEVTKLFRDLLINVTSFFRDAESFDALQKLVIPKLFDGKGSGSTVRAWVPGCATGEEVFSIAILMREHMDGLAHKPHVQIFATDIDDPALTVARSARYPEPLLDAVSPERRERFFIRDGAGFVLSKDLREMCIFSPHSVIRDPPFSRMDLVSCRNLLIYFGPQIQEQVLPTFHYALRPAGYLFLGTSENIGQYGDLFAPVDKKQRIFQRRDHATSPIRLPVSVRGGRGLDTGGEPQVRRSGRGPVALRQAVEAQVLERFAPAFVVVDAKGQAVFYSARTGKYLEAPQGVPNRQLVAMARKGLRLELRAALREAVESRRAVTRQHVVVEEDGDRVQVINLAVEPLADQSAGEPLFLVVFEDLGAAVSREIAEGLSRHDRDASVSDLENELRDTREVLQGTIEEYETALEELKSSNEELVSVNEEAQSANEELEASKEEMQSLNEELNTINAELIEKVEQLDRAHNDLKNLFESTGIATVFLDRALVIRSFTPAASAFFNLIPADAGRPLTDLAGHLSYPEMKEHIRRVFETGDSVEHRVSQDDGQAQYLARLLPYRDADGRTQGVVATFIDVTTLADAEAHQRVLIAELNHRVKNMLTVVISIAQRTAAGTVSKDAFRGALIGRVYSMSRAYELLARENWKQASVPELVRQEIAPFGHEHVLLDGPDIHLRPRAGLAIGMILHELATNAAKYGALSVPAGRVTINWSQEPDRFVLRWREHGGPPTSQPAGFGFGLTLVQKEVDHTMGGTTRIAFLPDGLSVDLQFPLD